MILHSSRTINAPALRVFDMIRNVDVHAGAVPDIQARAEAGRRHGNLELHETTRWSARYFGIRFRITMKVTVCDPPTCYHETNITGPFNLFRHRYSLKDLREGQTLLTDELTLETGFGWFGRVLDKHLLGPRLQRALETRMDHLKAWSEDGNWQTLLRHKATDI